MKKIIPFLVLFSAALYSADIAVVTLAAGKEYNAAVRTSTENKEQYCKKHGYDFFCGTESLDTTRSFSWTKIKLLLNVMATGKHKWIFWTDADSLIMNDSIRLEEFIDPDHDFILPGDYHAVDPSELTPEWQQMAPHVVNINAGEFFLRNSPWSIAFLEECYNKTEFVQHSWWEQGAMTDLLTTKSEYFEKVKLVPYRLMNSLPVGHSIGPSFTPTAYERGDFILHFPGTRLANLQAVLEKHAAQIVHDRSFVSLDDYLKMYGYKLPLSSEERIEFSSLACGDKAITKILAVGLLSGQNVVNLLSLFPQATMRAMDPNVYFYTDVVLEYCARWFGDRFAFAEGNLSSAEFDAQESYDLIFLNKSFRYAECKKEIALCASLAHSDTKLVVNNYHLPGVHKAVLDCVKSGLIQIAEIHETTDDEGNIKAWVEGSLR
jgi:hypothetical protein